MAETAQSRAAAARARGRNGGRPKVGPGELLIRIEASGICGSDVMEWYRIKKAPLVLGHEICGEIDQLLPCRINHL